MTDEPPISSSATPSVGDPDEAEILARLHRMARRASRADLLIAMSAVSERTAAGAVDEAALLETLVQMDRLLAREMEDDGEAARRSLFGEPPEQELQQ